MCFIIGQFISAGVLKGFVHRRDQWGYRIPYALQWVWPAFLIPLIYFAPESPWHLARKNRLEEAEQSIRRLQSGEGAQDPKKTLATIIYTNNLEEQLCVGTSYHDCFKGFELRRTEIACFCFGGQLVCGLVFAYGEFYPCTRLAAVSRSTRSESLPMRPVQVSAMLTFYSLYLFLPASRTRC